MSIEPLFFFLLLPTFIWLRSFSSLWRAPQINLFEMCVFVKWLLFPTSDLSVSWLSLHLIEPQINFLRTQSLSSFRAQEALHPSSLVLLDSHIHSSRPSFPLNSPAGPWISFITMGLKWTNLFYWLVYPQGKSDLITPLVIYEQRIFLYMLSRSFHLDKLWFPSKF